MLNYFTFIMMIERDNCRPSHKTKAERREVAVTLCVITGICHPCLEKGSSVFLQTVLFASEPLFQNAAYHPRCPHLLSNKYTMNILPLANLMTLILVQNVN